MSCKSINSLDVTHKKRFFCTHQSPTQLKSMSNNNYKNKSPKIFKKEFSEIIIKKLPFELTNSQLNVLNEINKDLLSNKRMFRIIQGDVGSGKTIVSLLSIFSNCLMICRSYD